MNMNYFSLIYPYYNKKYKNKKNKNKNKQKNEF